jgi:hypothetical protein
MEKNRLSRNKSADTINYFLTVAPRRHNKERTVSSINEISTTGCSHAKE